MTLTYAVLDDVAVRPRADRSIRRTFTARCNAQVVAEYDAAEHRDRGAWREGLDYSDIAEWSELSTPAEN